MWRQKVLTAKGGSDVASCQKFCWSGQSLAIAAVKQIFLDNKKLLISYVVGRSFMGLIFFFNWGGGGFFKQNGPNKRI